MLGDRDNFKITIKISCIKDDEVLFENSLDEAVRRIKEGFISFRDGNEDEEYSFYIDKNEEIKEV